jgi:hypothetical protein
MRWAEAGRSNRDGIESCLRLFLVMMVSMTREQIIATVGQLAVVLNSLQQFDNIEVLPAVKGVADPTDRTKCVVATYYRSVANVRTALKLNDPSHFQALAMIARSLIELAMDIRLIDVVPHSVERMIAFGDSEKLKTARKIVQFAQNTNSSHDCTVHQQFIVTNEARIVADRQQLWGLAQGPEHWSSMKIKDRAVKLGAPFDELYEVKYRHLSWHAHSGLTGVLGVESMAFAAMCGDALGIAVVCYEQVLASTVKELGIDRKDPWIWNKLKFARLVACTESPAERSQLERELLM